MHAISSYRGNRPTNTQTGSITIHCAAATAQCNSKTHVPCTTWTSSYAVLMFRILSDFKNLPPRSSRAVWKLQIFATYNIRITRVGDNTWQSPYRTVSKGMYSAAGMTQLFVFSPCSLRPRAQLSLSLRF